MTNNTLGFGPIIPIYLDYEHDLPFVNNSRVVPTSDGTNEPIPRHLLPIGDRLKNDDEPAVDTTRFMRDSISKLEEIPTYAFRGIMDQSLSHVDGKSVLYGEDGIAGNVNPWEGSNDGSSLFDEDDMKDLYRLMGYNCDPASAYEQSYT